MTPLFLEVLNGDARGASVRLEAGDMVRIGNLKGANIFTTRLPSGVGITVFHTGEGCTGTGSAGEHLVIGEEPFEFHGMKMLVDTGGAPRSESRIGLLAPLVCRPGENWFAIIDASGLACLPAFRSEPGTRSRMLLADGAAAEQLEDAGPWLLQFATQDSLTRVLRSAWSQKSGIFCSSSADFEAVWKHFSGLLRVGYGGGSAHFRYYDPGVLHIVLRKQRDLGEGILEPLSALLYPLERGARGVLAAKADGVWGMAEIDPYESANAQEGAPPNG